MNILLESPSGVKSAVYHDLDSNKLLRQEIFILLYIYRKGSAISSEITKELMIDKSSVARALNNLRKKGMIIYSGVKRSKITGKLNSIYQTTEIGIKLLSAKMAGVS